MFRGANFPKIERTASASALDARRLLEALRPYLPLAAHPRGRLRVSLIRASPRGAFDERCKVTGVFDAGDAFGLLCQIEVGDNADPAIFFAPIVELAFDRRHPIAREIVDYRRRRAQTRVEDSA
jgi:hypothetical protein